MSRLYQITCSTCKMPTTNATWSINAWFCTKCWQMKFLTHTPTKLTVEPKKTEDILFMASLSGM